jgi:hypothetical protein
MPMKKIYKNKDIRLTGTLAERWMTLQRRFGYSTNINLMDDLLYFFETNSVNPKDRFNSLLERLILKMDEINKDNNRVIAVVRKIENDKLNGIYTAVTQDINYQLKEIKKCVYDEDKLYNNNPQTSSNIESITSEKNIDYITNKYEEKLKKEVDAYKLLEQEYDEKSKQLGNIYNKFKKLSKLYSVEKGTFSKPKIVIEMTEEEFLELIKL